MNWIDINEQLPPDIKKFRGTTYLVTVTCFAWEKAQTMVMEWECTTVRNQEVTRWKWQDRIKDDDWIVTHWMQLPSPAKV